MMGLAVLMILKKGPQMAPAPSPDEINDALGGDIDKVINSGGTFDEKFVYLNKFQIPEMNTNFI